MGAFVSTIKADQSVASLITALRRDLSQHIVPNNDDAFTVTVRLSAYDMLEILAASPYKLLPEMQKAMDEGLLEFIAAKPESVEGFGMTLAEHREAFPNPNRTTFFHLPPEIRMQIYREVVRSNKIIALRRYVTEDVHKTTRVIRVDCEDARTRRRMRQKAPDLDEETGKLVSKVPSAFTLLRVCRAFYQEAGPIAYAENVFKFEDRWTAELFLASIGTKQLNWLRFVAFDDKDDPEAIGEQLTKGSLQGLKLKSVVMPSPLLIAFMSDQAIPPAKKTKAFETWIAALINHVREYLRLQYITDPCEANLERLAKLFKSGNTLIDACSTCDLHHALGIKCQHECTLQIHAYWKDVRNKYDGRQIQAVLQDGVRKELQSIKMSIEGGQVKVVDKAGKEKTKKCRKRQAPTPLDEAQTRSLHKRSRST